MMPKEVEEWVVQIAQDLDDFQGGRPTLLTESHIKNDLFVLSRYHAPLYAEYNRCID